MPLNSIIVLSQTLTELSMVILKKIRALRSIEGGAELCLSYLDPTRLAKPPTITTVLPVQLLIHNNT